MINSRSDFNWKEGSNPNRGNIRVKRKSSRSRPCRQISHTKSSRSLVPTSSSQNNFGYPYGAYYYTQPPPGYLNRGKHPMYQPLYNYNGSLLHSTQLSAQQGQSFNPNTQLNLNYPNVLSSQSSSGLGYLPYTSVQFQSPGFGVNRNAQQQNNETGSDTKPGSTEDQTSKSEIEEDVADTTNINMFVYIVSCLIMEDSNLLHGTLVDPNTINWREVSLRFRTLSPGECRKLWLKHYRNHKIIRSAEGVLICCDANILESATTRDANNVFSQDSKDSSDQYEPVMNIQTNSNNNTNTGTGTGTASNSGSSMSGRKRKRDKLSADEIEIVEKLQSTYGNKWTFIAEQMRTGRSGIEIKNYWYNLRSKKALRMYNAHQQQKKEKYTQESSSTDYRPPT